MKKAYILILTLFFSASTFAVDFGEVSFNIGATMPEDSYKKYSDNGVYAHVRVIPHFNKLSALSGFFDMSGTFFKETREDIVLDDGLFIYDAVRQTNEYSIAMHMGLQLGTDSKNSFFRPKAGIGGGLYLFNTNTQYQDYDYDPDYDELIDEDNNTQIRVGWRGYVGTDFYFTPKWGLTFDYSYDHVLNLHQSINYVEGEGIVKVGQTARFHNVSIGVIIPFDTFED